MTRDDRDIESSNPSKSFKVGDFDRLSGFFTPVWESKRRIRSESPIPSSGPASSKSGAGKAPTKPTPPKGVDAAASPAGVPEARGTAPSPAPADSATPKASDAATDKGAALAPAKLDAAKATAAKAPSAAPAKQSEVAAAAPAATTASAPSGVGQQQLPSVLTKSLKATIRQGPSPAPGKKTEPSAAAPAPTVAPAPAAPAPSAAPAATSAVPRPSVAALAKAGPNLPSEAFLDPKPDFRIPLSKFTPAPQAERIHTTRQRSLRASVAATRVHEQLRARGEADSFDAPELQWGTETDLETLAPQVGAAAGAASDDPYPLHLLRRLRRTIHLATPVPESVREMIARYGRN